MLKRYLRELYGEKYTYVCEEMFEGIMDAIFGIISNNDYDKITDGMPIYAGFTVYKLNRYDDMYEILAPDFSDNDPTIAFKTDLTESFLVEYRQAALVSGLGITGKPFYSTENVLIEEGALEADEVIMTRVPTVDGSRWQIVKVGGSDDALSYLPDFYEIPACRLVKNYSWAADVLALPDNYSVRFRKGEIKKIYSDSKKKLYG